MRRVATFSLLHILLHGLLCPPAAEAAGGMPKGMQDRSAAVTLACAEISRNLEAHERLRVARAEGPGRYGSGGAAGAECHVAARGGALRAGTFPHDILRRGLLSSGWREDATRAGDGAGTTTFTLLRNGIVCTISASWHKTAGDTPDSAAAAFTHEIEATCLASTEGGAP